MRKKISIYYSDNCQKHDMGPDHVEIAQRVSVVKDYLQGSSLKDQIEWLRPEHATKEQLALAHEPEYVDTIFVNAPTDGRFYLDPDTSMSPGSLEAVLCATGSTVAAVDLIKENNTPVFCLTRPPGHHAEAGQAMGFCIFNHVAVAALYAQQEGYRRVAIVDFDVHHGNGTEHIVSDKSDILFLSCFQSAYYPFTGTGPTASNIVNTPFPAGTTGIQFREFITQNWQPALTAFSPDLLIISAGFDAHAEDLISQVSLNEDDYFWLSQKLQEWTLASTEGRVISVFEGGYNLSILGPCVEAHLKGLLSSDER